MNRFLIGVSLAVLALPTFALAEARDSVTDVSQVTVTGTRAKPRTALQSLEPIDVISRDTIDQTGSAELVDTLASLVPSFDVQSLPALDATIFVRPARLRNLSPDQTLVLLNGKRVHRSAMMMNPSYGNSFQAPDLDQIANSALSSIDVLRDGAAAQYGSDAIAGVINLNLDASAGFRGFAQYGQYKEGDGEGPRVGAHAGFRSGTTFLALTAEYVNTGATSRSQAGSNQLLSQAAYPNLTFPNPAVKWGLPSREATRVAMTAGTDVMGVSLYTFGTWGQGKGVGDFNYRGPKGSYASVFATSPVFPGWNLLTLYPTGFTPHFGSRDHDVNLIAGAKKTFANGAKLDFSVDYGRNDISYFMTNSINASLGPNSPTAFNDGAVQQTELSYTLDGSIPVTLPLLARSATLAAGVEQRTEHFGISAGEPASYAFGPAAPALACCSSGFPGYAPVSAGKWSQDSSAAYLDLDLPFTSDWSMDAAVRYEDFNTFGSSTTWKLSSRYELTPGVAIRGTMGTGFRAPTPAQLYSEGLSQFLPSATASITTTGRFSPVGPVAQVLNQRAGVSIQPLRPETSRNFSVGMVFQTSFGLQTTVDLYRIEIAHRLNTSTSYVLTAAENATLTALKIPNLQGIYSANFLQNDFNTANQGVDIVSVYTRPAGPGVLSLTGAASFLDTEVTGGSRATNPYAKKMYENSLPRYRATLSGSYTVGPLELTARGRYYGRWSDFTDTFPATAAPGAAYPTYAPQTFGSVIFCDLIANYRVTQNITVRAGAENAFDKYPDKARYQTFRGLIYSRNTPYSTDGAYYYARIDFKY